MITPVDFRQNIYRWNHANLLSHVRCWSDPSPLMFVRTLHGGNDSGRNQPKGAELLAENVADGLLRRRFGLRPPRLRAAVRRVRGEDA
jgi:hypothetical protein